MQRIALATLIALSLTGTTLAAPNAPQATPATVRTEATAPVAKVAAPRATCAAYRAINPTSALTDAVCRQAGLRR